MQTPINNDAVYVEDGVEYHAVTQPLCAPTSDPFDGPCCAFYRAETSCRNRPCVPHKRNDRTAVIFVRAE